MEKTLEKILVKLDGIEKNQVTLDTKIDNLDVTLNTRMDNQDIAFNTRMDIQDVTFNTRMDNLNVTFNTRMDNLDVAFNTRMDSLDKSVSDLNNSLIQGLAPYFGNEKVIGDNFIDLTSKIENQKNAIDVLSSRSIQQEADIKVLNRIVRNQ